MIINRKLSEKTCIFDIKERNVMIKIVYIEYS